MPKKIFIGVAWPYVNGDIHIGHLAGYLLPADIFARFHRYIGNDVLMVSGSDCFGTPITLEAEKRGVAPEAIVEEYHRKHVELFKKLHISFDIFTKTTTDNHIRIAQDFFLKFLEKGYIFKKTVEQYYDSKNDRFLPDRYVEGECPHCGYGEARSDQCDNCSKVLDQGELKNPKSKVTGSALQMKESEHYFFDLAKIEPFLKRYIKGKKGEWKDWVYKETEGWLTQGLKPRAFTRDLEWGVPLPIDQIPENDRIEEIEKKRFYVWWEAVMGYYSASIEWSERTGRDWKEFWLNDDALHAYFMGKDNLPFHTMFWPGELNVFDKKLHLPDLLVINQYLTFKGKQFSKSRGVTVDSAYIVDTYGLDTVRFYLSLVMPEYADTSFNWGDFRERHNGVLIGNLGNFINRTLVLSENLEFGDSWEIKENIVSDVARIVGEAKQNLAKPEFKKYVESILELSNIGNKYLSNEKPWMVEDEEQKKEILRNALFIITAILLIMKPLFIDTTEKLENMLGISFDEWPKEEADAIKKALLNIKIKNPKPLFTKIDEESIKKENGRD